MADAIHRHMMTLHIPGINVDNDGCQRGCVTFHGRLVCVANATAMDGTCRCQYRHLRLHRLRRRRCRLCAN